MPRTRIKICGVRTPDVALAAAEAGADAIGLVFAPGSPRRVTIGAAREIVDALPAFVEPVALFVDATADEIRRTCEDAGIRTVQLHGKESTEFAASLAPLRVVKAFAFQREIFNETLAAWNSRPRNFVAMLWDTPSDGQALPGGSGRAFAWKDLAAMRDSGDLPAGMRIIVAGGLTPANVGDAIRTLSPFAVDVSSGVESARGVKDPGMIRAFCDAVRDSDAR